jgi:hypothetical protein
MMSCIISSDQRYKTDLKSYSRRHELLSVGSLSWALMNEDRSEIKIRDLTIFLTVREQMMDRQR